MRKSIVLGLLFVMHLANAQHHSSMAKGNNAFRQRFMMKAGGKVVYHLYVTDTVVNYTGKRVNAIAINGSIPAPALHFTEGDTAEIHVHNLMHMETSIHWHGLILPNNQDGVPYLTTAPIKGHSTFIYKFPIV
ncbi:MAG TPA: multicopper oxidase domain-containing protein, partial [Segetibacter sp.]